MTNMHKALDAAIKLFGEKRGRTMLGCDWGLKVSLPADKERCTEPADRRVVLHHPNGGEMYVQLCESHEAAVTVRTDPHQDGRQE